MASILHPRKDGVVLRIKLRFFCDRSGGLLLYHFDHFTGIALFVELQHEIFGFDRITFMVKFNRAGDAPEALDITHRGGDLGPAWFLAGIGFGPLLNRPNADHRGVVTVHAEGFDLFAEALLKFFRECCGFRIRLWRAGDTGIVTAHWAEGPAIFTISAESNPSGPINLALTLFSRICFEQKSALVINAAEIDQVRVFCFKRDNHGRKVGAFLRAIEAQNIQAKLFCLVAKVLRDPLAIESFVVNNVDRLGFQFLSGEARPDRTLHVVAAADAIDVGIARSVISVAVFAGEIIANMTSL